MQINEVAVSGASIIPSEYTQLKLHMTSATEPEPYKITGTCEDYSVGLYGPFDDNNSYDGTCAKYPDIRINFGSKICIKGLNIRFQNGNQTYFQSGFAIYGSNDGESWSMIDSIPAGTSYSTKFCELELLINNNTAYMYYRLCDSEMFLYDCYFYTGTPDPIVNYLIQTSDGIISLLDSNYNSETDSYNILDSSITDYSSYYANLYNKSPATEVTINDNTFKPIDKINKPFKILLENSNQISVKISNKCLLITDNISLTAYDIINSLSVDNSVGENNSIKFIFSIDNGTTWKTYKDNAITNIDITIPDSNYSSDNKTIWDNAITSIETNGISINDMSNIPFNTLLDMDSIKFAIVLSDMDSSQDCKISSISVNYTINGEYTEMNKDECKIEVVNNIPIVTSLITTNKLLIDVYK